MLIESVDELIHSSDSEADDLVEEPASKRSRRAAREEKRSKAWLKEDEDIVDFLDPSAARKVIGKDFIVVIFKYLYKQTIIIIIFCPPAQSRGREN